MIQKLSNGKYDVYEYGWGEGLHGLTEDDLYALKGEIESTLFQKHADKWEAEHGHRR